MPASNSLNYANGVEIKVVGGGENFLMKSWGTSERNHSAFRLGSLLVARAKILHAVVRTQRKEFSTNWEIRGQLSK